MKATIDQSPYLWQRSYSGTIEVEGETYGYSVDTRETEQTAEEIVQIEWEEYPKQVGEERKKLEMEIMETWTEQHYAHYKREQGESAE